MKPAGLSIRETARRFTISRPTLAKWIKSGKISAIRTDGGEWLIDSAEMLRTGISARSQTGPEMDNLPAFTPDNLSTIAGQVENLTGQEIEALRARLAEAEQRAAVAEALATERAGRIDDLRRMLLLTDQRGKPDQAKDATQRSWWRRLIGR